MIEKIIINKQEISPRFKQIEDSILKGIKTGNIQLGDQLPSINAVCNEFGISPGTVAKAYENLKNRGIIASHQGKGFYIASKDVNMKYKVFLLFDRLNAYKEILYYSFIEHLGEGEVDVFFHHYDIQRLSSLINHALGHYTHYVIMPHFNEDVSFAIKKVPTDKLYLLDKDLPVIKGKYSAVYQDFEHDIFTCLSSGIHLIKKYQRINLIRSKSEFQFIPDGIIRGFKRFGEKYELNYQIIDSFNASALKRGEAYLIFPDNELIGAIKMIKQHTWKLGKDIGIISYDDTPMKEFLFGGITTISTDFILMGKTLARLIMEENSAYVKNPSSLIIRESL